MKLNSRMVVLFVAAALIVASSGCATHVGDRAAGSVTIDQTFTDTPLRDVLAFIEKATSMGMATDASLDLDQKITVRLEELSPSEAVAAVARAAGCEWAFDPDLLNKVDTHQPLGEEYRYYPVYFVAKKVDMSVFPFPQGEAAKAQWMARFEKGERLYKAGSHSAAKVALEEVRSADVTLDWSVQRTLSSYLNDIDTKLAEEEALNEIKRKLSTGIQHYHEHNYKAAIGLLSEVEASELASWTLRSRVKEYREKAEARLAAEDQREILTEKLFSEVKDLLEAGRYDEVVAAVIEIRAAGISLGEINDARLKEYRRIARTKMAEEIQRIELERVARIEGQALLDEAASLYLTGKLESAREVYSRLASMSEYLDPYQGAMVELRLDEIEGALALLFNRPFLLAAEAEAAREEEARRAAAAVAQVKEELTPDIRVASEEGHVLIVTHPEAVVENVINTINAINVPRHQIKIEVTITEITWSTDDDKGMNWMTTLMGLDAEGVMEFAKATGPVDSSTIVGTIIAQLSAFAQTGKIDIKANRTIITLEGETGEIKIVEEKYFVIPTGNLNFPTSDLEIIESE